MSTIEFLITEADIEGYAEVSGDNNPIHLDRHYAQKHGFPDKIAHGMLTMGKVWSVLSDHILSPIDWPDKYEMKFLSPVFVGAVVILNVHRKENQLSIEALCAGKPVLKGKMTLLK